ncbi:hypothetical protein L1887_49493 [Cichorium endivia]|nr:hypothetical protein L1887_49493 [Cichorium endivia]
MEAGSMRAEVAGGEGCCKIWARRLHTHTRRRAAAASDERAYLAGRLGSVDLKLRLALRHRQPPKQAHDDITPPASALPPHPTLAIKGPLHSALSHRLARPSYTSFSSSLVHCPATARVPCPAIVGSCYNRRTGTTNPSLDVITANARRSQRTIRPCRAST